MPRLLTALTLAASLAGCTDMTGNYPKLVPTDELLNAPAVEPSPQAGLEARAAALRARATAIRAE